MALLTLTFGDWSNDGHSLSTTFVFESNKTVKELENLSQNLPINFEKFCTDYEDDKVPIWVQKKLTALEIDLQDFLDHTITDSEEEQSISIDGLVELWVAVMKKTNPDLVLDLVQLPSGELNIGYGCYFN